MNTKQAESMKALTSSLILLSAMPAPENHEHAVDEIVSVRIREADAEGEQWVRIEFCADHTYEAQTYFDRVLKSLKVFEGIEVVSHRRPRYGSSNPSYITLDLADDEALRAKF